MQTANGDVADFRSQRASPMSQVAAQSGQASVDTPAVQTLDAPALDPETSDGGPSQQFQQLAVSPPDLVAETSPGILVHFLVSPDGATTQAGSLTPPPQWLDRVEDLYSNFRAVQPDLDYTMLLENLPEPEAQPTPTVTPVEMSNTVAYGGKLQQRQSTRNRNEYAARQSFQGANSTLMSQQRAASPSGSLGVMKALWQNDRLLLARRAHNGDTETIEGCWLNWPKLKQVLIAEVVDLVPNATLEPILEGDDSETAHRLATIPARLVPGDMPFEPMPFLTPARSSLIVAWGCLVMAAIAVALLLGGTLSLSERRHDFVSAVTHELRTPLTTFRMYSEMLASGMVADEKKQGYLEKLQQESDRLGHLVENVLAFARVERSSRTEERSEVALRPFLDDLATRLGEHARQQDVSLSLKRDLAEDAHSAKIAPGTIEQILVNLVDNACKYGRNPERHSAPSDSTVDVVVSVTTTNNDILFTVQDWGPGVDADTVRRLFRPFSKSDHKAATSAPGVGLGLALSRRLARAMGGDLTYRSGRAPGARFQLRLPRT